jgi:hypothetical protein
MKTNFIDATAGSTHAVNVAVELYMPPTEAARVLDICTRSQQQQIELDHLRAEVQRLTPDDKHARDCRSNDLEALVLKALENITLNAKVVQALPCHRIGLVLKHLRIHLADYKIEKPPCYKTIKAILKKHGYL